MNMKKQTALIIGASGEIGYFIAKKISEENVRVILASRNLKLLSKINTEINENGGESYFYKIDVTSKKDISSFLDKITKKFGTIHFFVYCAGTGLPKPFLETPIEYLESVMNVNFKGFFITTQKVIPIMMKNKFGRIIVFASTAGKKGLGFASAYSASKAALINFCQSVSQEMAQYNITINSLCPRGLQTSFSKKAWELLAHYNGLTYDEYRKRELDTIGIYRELNIEDTWPVIKFLLLSSTNALTGQSINICGTYEVR